MSLLDDPRTTARKSVEMNVRAGLAKDFLMLRNEQVLDSIPRKEYMLGRIFQSMGEGLSKMKTSIKHSWSTEEINQLLNKKHEDAATQKAFEDYIANQIGGDTLEVMGSQKFLEDMEDNIAIGHLLTPHSTAPASTVQASKDTLKGDLQKILADTPEATSALNMLDSILKHMHDHGITKNTAFYKSFVEQAIIDPVNSSRVTMRKPTIMTGDPNVAESIKDLVVLYKDFNPAYLLQQYQRHKYMHAAQNIERAVSAITPPPAATPPVTTPDPTLYRDADGAMYLSSGSNTVLVTLDGAGRPYYENADGSKHPLGNNIPHTTIFGPQSLQLDPATDPTTYKVVNLTSRINLTNTSSFSFLSHQILDEKLEILSTEAKLRTLDTMNLGPSLRNIKISDSGAKTEYAARRLYIPRNANDGWHLARKTGKMIHKYGLGTVAGVITKTSGISLGGTLLAGAALGGAHHVIGAVITSRDATIATKKIASFILERQSRNTGSFEPHIQDRLMKLKDSGDIPALIQVITEMPEDKQDRITEIYQVTRKLTRELEARGEINEPWAAKTLGIMNTAEKRLLKFEVENARQELLGKEDITNPNSAGFRNSLHFNDLVLERNINQQVDARISAFGGRPQNTPAALRDALRNHIMRDEMTDVRKWGKSMGMVGSTMLASRLFSEAIHAVVDPGHFTEMFTGALSNAWDGTLHVGGGALQWNSIAGEFFWHGTGELLNGIGHSLSLDQLGASITGGVGDLLNNVSDEISQLIHASTSTPEAARALELVLGGIGIASTVGLVRGYKKNKAKKAAAGDSSKQTSMTDKAMKMIQDGLAKARSKGFIKKGALVAGMVVAPVPILAYYGLKKTGTLSAIGAPNIMAIPGFVKSQYHTVMPGQTRSEELASLLYGSKKELYARRITSVQKEVSELSNQDTIAKLFSTESRQHYTSIEKLFHELITHADGAIKNDLMLGKYYLKQLEGIRAGTGNLAAHKATLGQFSTYLDAIQKRIPSYNIN